MPLMPGFLADVLTQARNGGYLLSVETAMSLNLPPTVMIYDDRQPDKWTKEDKKLAMAWTILERERCQYCGQYMWICRSSNPKLTFSVRTDTCYADAEMNSSSNKKKSEKLRPGEHLYTVPEMYDDSPLPSRHEYLKSLAE